jgi:hypothetical protein
MAKRRKMGLHGSPEHHAEQAVSWMEEAESEYTKAANFVKSRRCGAALKTLVEAVGSHEAGIVHEDESNRSTPENLRKSVRKKKAIAYGEFAKKCIVAKAKPALSGMRRRRSRR